MFGQKKEGSGRMRVPELLKAIQGEYEQVLQESNMLKMQEDEYERKFQQQLSELSNIQQTLFELDRTHQMVRARYEDELRLTRREGSGGSGERSGVTPQLSSKEAQSLNGSGLRNLGLTANILREGGLSSGTAPNLSSSSAPSASSGSNNNNNSNNANNSSANGNGPNPSSSNNNNSTNSNGSSAKEPEALTKPLSANIFSNSIPSGPRDQSHFNALAGLNSLTKTRGPESHLPPPSKSSKVEHEDFSSHESHSNFDGTNFIQRDKTKPVSQDWCVGFNPSVKTSFNPELVHTLEHDSVVCSVNFSPNGLLLATGSDKKASIYSVKTGELLNVFPYETNAESLHVRSVCFSPNNKFLITGAEDKQIKILDIEKQLVKSVLTGHEASVYSVDFSRDGRLILSGSEDKRAKIWDAEKGECLYTLGNDEIGPKDEVTSVAFSPDGRLVAAASLDRIVRLWDATTGYFLERYEGHSDSVYSVAFSPDGRTLASGSLDNTVKLWDLSGSRSRSRCRTTLVGHKDFVLSICWAPDGQSLLSASKDQTVQFWDTTSAASHVLLEGHSNSVISVAANPKTPLIATGSGDHRCRVWKYRN